MKRMSLGASYSGMISKTEDGNYTPYVPAQKITPDIHYSFLLKNNHSLDVFTNVEFDLAQNNIAPHEIATPAYSLLNLGASTSFECHEQVYTISLTGNNLLDTAYYDHLSRFKYFGLLNMGRNIVLNFKVQFPGQVAVK